MSIGNQEYKVLLKLLIIFFEILVISDLQGLVVVQRLEYEYKSGSVQIRIVINCRRF